MNEKYVKLDECLDKFMYKVVFKRFIDSTDEKTTEWAIIIPIHEIINTLKSYSDNILDISETDDGIVDYIFKGMQNRLRLTVDVRLIITDINYTPGSSMNINKGVLFHYNSQKDECDKIDKELTNLSFIDKVKLNIVKDHFVLDNEDLSTFVSKYIEDELSSLFVKAKLCNHVTFINGEKCLCARVTEGVLLNSIITIVRESSNSDKVIAINSLQVLSKIESLINELLPKEITLSVTRDNVRSIKEITVLKYEFTLPISNII